MCWGNTNEPISTLSLYGRLRLGVPDFGGGKEGKLAVQQWTEERDRGRVWREEERECPGPKGDSASLAVVGSFTLQRTVKVVSERWTAAPCQSFTNPALPKIHMLIKLCTR